MQITLSKRKEDILRRLVEDYVRTGQPVGSKHLVEQAGMAVSASTVRSELAELETLGLLTHPHTSAGRIPTERGYRFYVDVLLAGLEPRPAAFPLDRTAVRSEVDAALQATTEVLSQVTHLLAMVSAPPLETTTVRHVEVLALQPQVVVVVVITSTGGVAKRVVAFDQPVDPGLAHWADEYLNERIAGVQLGTHMLRSRLEDPGLSARERSFLAALKPAFIDLVNLDEQRVFVGGAAGLLDEARAEEREACQRLLTMLEKRAALLELIGDALEPRRPFVRVGDELEHPALRHVSLVGATYGLTNRTLGAVTLLGPLRMDYGKAIRSVRSAAFELSRFVEEVYEPN
jgi:heat-inducible transcriptional repressor